MEVTMDMIKDLKIVTLESDTYLGHVSEGADGAPTTIKNASRCRNKADELSVLWWMKEANLDELDEVVIHGSKSYRVQALPTSLMRHFKECFGVMEEVKSKALAHWENQLFDAHMASS